LLLLLAACNDYHTQTRAFVASTPCGQGPFDVHTRIEGKMGREGVEVVACTPHRLVGHVEFFANNIPLTTQSFGDVADNGRCVAGPATIVTTRAATTTTSSAEPSAAPGAATATSALVERPFDGDETPFEDELCKHYGLPSQSLADVVTTTDWLEPGTDLRVRIWSDAPNDLQGVIFMVRHEVSTKSKADVRKEEEEAEKEYRKHPSHDPAPPAPSTPDHGAPPAPLAEQPPPAPTGNATWIAGYWTWTGHEWGWVAGFWRDDFLRAAMPAQRIEMPGAPPAPAAVWIAGAWQLRAGSWIWIRGRWR
jgi:hypothetical protein